jgi:hypothetical protein
MVDEFSEDASLARRIHRKNGAGKWRLLLSVERPFIPGRELSRAFFEGIVSPIVGSAFPG